MLLALVVLWIGLLIWQFDHSSEQARVPLTHVSGQHTGRPAAAAGGDLQVHLERLAAIKGQREATFATPRNIFASLLPQVEPVAVPSPAPRRGRSRGPAKPAAPPSAEPLVEETTVEAKVEEEPVEEGPKDRRLKIERLRIATELNPVPVCRIHGGRRRCAEEKAWRWWCITTKCMSSKRAKSSAAKCWSKTSHRRKSRCGRRIENHADHSGHE